MLAVGTNGFSFLYSNIGATPSLVTPGTSVIPGTSNVEGSWTQVASSANIAQDVYFFTVWVSDGATNANIKDHLLDIGVDPAGGTSWAAIISDIVCGESAAGSTGGGLFLEFPLYIKAGSSIAVRVQGSNATPGTVQITMNFYGQPSHPELIRVGQYAETIGTITNTTGVSFTPGTTGANGTWVSLGTLTRACWWFQLCVQITNAIITGQAYHFDLAVGDASNKHIVVQGLRVVGSTIEELRYCGQSAQLSGYASKPAGTELWVRGTCSAAPASGWNAVAVGIGG